MDFKLKINGTQADMTYEKEDTILNNIYLSLMIEKGSFFLNLDFGSRLHLLKRAKATATNVVLAKIYCEEALQWILDTERAKTIDVYTAIDGSQQLKRLTILVLAVQADGRDVTFETFLEVI